MDIVQHGALSGSLHFGIDLNSNGSENCQHKSCGGNNRLLAIQSAGKKTTNGPISICMSHCQVLFIHVGVDLSTYQKTVHMNVFKDSGY